MASSYTTLLKFNKPALGDAGWGTSVNSGYTDMVEQALTGALSVAVTAGGTTTLAAIANGVSSDARNQFLTITGSLTSVQTATVIVPAGVSTNFKFYIVSNVAGGTVTVATAAGTSVAIPTGRSMTLRVTNNGVEETQTYSQNFATVTAAYGTSTTQVATTAFVQAALEALHPVGSIYINATNSTNPATLFGFGTWVAFGAGRVPVGFDSGNTLFDAAEETGGSADAIVVSHTHTATSTVTDPQHSHTMPGNYLQNNAAGGGIASGSGVGYGTATAAASTGVTVATTIASVGSSGTNANYQPYITVYMWKRTA